MRFDLEAREIFHFLFLERLLRISDPKFYILKGGVNLRFFFKSPRYSEDMDLDVVGGAVHTLKKNGYKILRDASFLRNLKTFGIENLQLNDPTKAKQTDSVQRFRVRLITAAGEELPTKVEFSRREKNKLPFSFDLIEPEIARKYQRLSFRCQHYEASAALNQKIVALAKRDVTQVRDVFDLFLLHTGGYKTDPDLIKKETLLSARKNLESLSYADYHGQVEEYLDPEVRVHYGGENNWGDTKTTVKRILGDGK